ALSVCRAKRAVSGENRQLSSIDAVVRPCCRSFRSRRAIPGAQRFASRDAGAGSGNGPLPTWIGAGAAAGTNRAPEPGTNEGVATRLQQVASIAVLVRYKEALRPHMREHDANVIAIPVRSLRFLVVFDDEDQRFLLVRTLSRLGMTNVVEARSGRAALDI